MSPPVGVAASRADARTAGDRAVVWLLAAVLVVATALRLVHLGTELWLDEIDTLARHVAFPWHQIVVTYDSQNQHPFYSLLARLAYVTTGGAPWSIRLPAVVFGVGSLGAAFWLARRLTTRAEALLVTLVLAVSYHHVWFSQNARGYTAMLFFVVVGTGALLRLVEEVGARPWRLVWLYAAAMGLATYTHLTAALVAVGHALAWMLSLTWRRDYRSANRWRWPLAGLAASALLTLVLYAPVLPELVRTVLAPTMEGVAVEWTSGRWMLAEALRVLGAGIPGGRLTVLVALGVLAVGVASYWQQSRLFVLCALVPVAVTATTMLALEHNLWPRFFFFAAVFLVLFALRGGFVVVRAVIPRAAAEQLAVAGAVGVAALSALTVPRAWQPKQQLYAAAAFVDAQRVPGDAVVALDLAADAYRLYRTPPQWRLTQSLDELRAVERASSRTWVVYAFPTRLHAAFPALAAHVTDSSSYRVVRVFPATVSGAEVHVLLHDSPPTHD